MPRIRIRSALRAWPFLALAIIASMIVAMIAPYQLGVMVWGLAKVTLFGYIGYWTDRGMFPYARPHIAPPTGDITYDRHAALRRAIIVAAAMVAGGTGV